ncbi:MAG: diaminopimelate epimerase [Rhodobacterales bacterium]|nr:MAG: diaminopimelate epimerase [Rhodobacterales bacterium]
MHGLGNDFVVIDSRGKGDVVSVDLARALGNRHMGVGFDQLAVISAGSHDGHLQFFNSDGSRSSTCGNATRCIARYLMQQTGARELHLSSDHGDLFARDAGGGLTSVNMGQPQLDWKDVPLARQIETVMLPIEGAPTATGMGNPHCTFFVEDVAAIDLAEFGAAHEHHPLYPQRTNVQIAQITGPDQIRMRVWERGVGITLASGSSSCATAVAAARRGLTGRKVQIDLDGGRLQIDWRADGVLGCRLNAYESEAMKDLAGQAGLKNAVVVNTCAVTAEAVRKSRQEIRRLRRENPDAKVIVTGCAAQVEPETFAKMDEVDLVVGNSEKMQPGTWAQFGPDFIGQSERVQVNDIMSVTETAGHLIDGFGSRSRAYVQVQNGCDHRCTFCIIPYGRGNSRSVPAGVVVDQIKRLVDKGYHEVVLTGVDLTSWGADLPAAPRFGDLVMRILRLVPDLPRLRISSIDSIEADDNLMCAIATEPRLMPHLHLSLQAGDNMILKRMKRRHLREDAIAFTEQARQLRPDITFGADIIAGFPTESDAMFENSLKLVTDCDLTWLHVFPYSARQGTPAARIPPVNGTIIKARAAQLRAAGKKQLIKHLRHQIGQQHSILMENPRMGRTEQFTEVVFDSDQPEGQIITAHIHGQNGKQLLGAAA